MGAELFYKDELENIEAYTLGEPFKVYLESGENDGNYYFPLLNADEIEYVLTVFPIDETNILSDSRSLNYNYSAELGSYLAHGLENIRILEEISLEDPITLLTNKEGYYYEKDGEVEVLVEVGSSVRDEDEFIETNFEELPVLEIKGDTDGIVTKSIGSTSIIYYDSLANFTIRETQGSNAWCAGYVIAALLNATKNTDSYYAEKVMREIYPNLDGAEFINTGLTAVQIRDYGRSQGRSTGLYAFSIPFLVNRSDIANNSGTAMLFRGEPEDELGYHAMALVAVFTFDDLTNFYLVWNPWYDGVSVIDASVNRMNFTNGWYYEWINSVRGF